jgi:hypothetical protein
MEVVMADKQEETGKPRGLSRLILEKTADAKNVAATAVADCLEKIHSTADRAEGRHLGPDDKPVSREDQPLIPVPHFG